MVRTLTLLSLLTLAAGLAVGLFAGQVFGARPTGSSPATDPRFETQVRTYVEKFGLDASKEEQVREILRDYDQELLQLLRVLRVKHQKEFHDVSAKADARMKAVLDSR